MSKFIKSNVLDYLTNVDSITSFHQRPINEVVTYDVLGASKIASKSNNSSVVMAYLNDMENTVLVIEEITEEQKDRYLDFTPNDALLEFGILIASHPQGVFIFNYDDLYKQKQIREQNVQVIEPVVESIVEVESLKDVTKRKKTSKKK